MERYSGVPAEKTAAAPEVLYKVEVVAEADVPVSGEEMVKPFTAKGAISFEYDGTHLSIYAEGYMWGAGKDKKRLASYQMPRESADKLVESAKIQYGEGRPVR